MAVIPVDTLKTAARKKFDAAKAQDPGLKETLFRDILLLEFKEWFKSEFFSWVDTPPCPRCGKPTKACGWVECSDLTSSELTAPCVRMGVPTPEEARDGAGRVELYRCEECGGADTVRFARYHSKPETLLVTRRGRCGEWANCFVLCCRALGWDTRHVLDWTDHVWAEVGTVVPAGARAR